MYNIKYKLNKITTADLTDKYYDKERIESYCKECINYNKVWSCPPYDFDTDKYVKKFKYLYIIGKQIIFSDDILNKINTKEKIEKYSYETIIKERKKLYDELIKLEEKYPGSRIVNSGNCILCKECTRKNNMKCRHEDSLRYSLESLGFDVANITKELLSIELKWSTAGQLPEYFTSVSGILTNFNIEKDVILKNILD